MNTSQELLANQEQLRLILTFLSEVNNPGSHVVPCQLRRIKPFISKNDLEIIIHAFISSITATYCILASVNIIYRDYNLDKMLQNDAFCLSFGRRALCVSQNWLEGKGTNGVDGRGVRLLMKDNGLADRLELWQGVEVEQEGRGTVQRYEGKVDEGVMRGDKDRAWRGSSRRSSFASAKDSHISSPLCTGSLTWAIEKWIPLGPRWGEKIPNLTSKRFFLRMANFRLALA